VIEAELLIESCAIVGGRPRDGDVQGADVLQDRRILVARISEEKRPFHGWEVSVLDALAAQHESGFRIPIGERVLDLCFTEEPTRALEYPCLEHLGRRSTVVGERKERFGFGLRTAFGRSREFCRRPALGRGHLVGGGRGRPS